MQVVLDFFGYIDPNPLSRHKKIYFSYLYWTTFILLNSLNNYYTPLINRYFKLRDRPREWDFNVVKSREVDEYTEISNTRIMLVAVSSMLISPFFHSFNNYKRLDTVINLSVLKKIGRKKSLMIKIVSPSRQDDSFDHDPLVANINRFVLRIFKCLDTEVHWSIISNIVTKDGPDNDDLYSLTTIETSRFGRRKCSKNRSKLEQVTDVIKSCSSPFNQIEISKKVLTKPLLEDTLKLIEKIS